MPPVYPGMRIGLLGGSFNPAHAGHVHASLVALRRLGLDRIWWLVSPQNPLKPESGMAPLAARLARAQEIARHPRIVVTDLERMLGTRFTSDTLKRLKARFPGQRFVLIMGADNFAELARWHRWPAIMAAVSIAVIARPGYSFAALASPAAWRYAARRLPEHKAALLLRRQPPAWVYLNAPLNPLSATELRKAPEWPPRDGAETQARSALQPSRSAAGHGAPGRAPAASPPRGGGGKRA